MPSPTWVCSSEGGEVRAYDALDGAGSLASFAGSQAGRELDTGPALGRFDGIGGGPGMRRGASAAGAHDGETGGSVGGMEAEGGGPETRGAGAGIVAGAAAIAYGGVGRAGGDADASALGRRTSGGGMRRELGGGNDEGRVTGGGGIDR